MIAPVNGIVMCVFYIVSTGLARRVNLLLASPPRSSEILRQTSHARSETTQKAHISPAKLHRLCTSHHGLVGYTVVFLSASSSKPPAVDVTKMATKITSKISTL